jgi:hypothetical protein
MGGRCTQARFLGGKPNRLRSTSSSVLCDRCVQEGYTAEDALTSHFEPVSNEQPGDEPLGCAKCEKPAVAGYGDIYFCEKHWEQLHTEETIAVFSSVNDPPLPPEEVFSELFRAARVLFTTNVTAEERIIPTLAFANRASVLPELEATRMRFAEIESSRETREHFSNNFCRRFKGLRPVTVSDQVLILSKVPVFVYVSRYPNAAGVKEVGLSVFMRSVKPEEVAEHYREALARERIPWEESSTGTFSWEFADTYLSMTVNSGKELNLGQAQRFTSRGVQIAFPPPQLIGELYAALKGSVNSRRFRGFAYALEGRQSGPAASPDNLIPACVAWYLRESGGIRDKHRLVRLVNQYLLAPCGKREIGVTSDNAIWKNIDKVADSIKRVEFALQNGWQPPWVRVSRTHA